MWGCVSTEKRECVKLLWQFDVMVRLCFHFPTPLSKLISTPTNTLPSHLHITHTLTHTHPHTHMHTPSHPLTHTHPHIPSHTHTLTSPHTHTPHTHTHRMQWQLFIRTATANLLVETRTWKTSRRDVSVLACSQPIDTPPLSPGLPPTFHQQSLLTKLYKVPAGGQCYITVRVDVLCFVFTVA